MLVRGAASAWWHPLTWLAPPAAYVLWYVAGDLHVHDALDPGRTGELVARLGVLLGLRIAGATGVRSVAPAQAASATA